MILSLGDHLLQLCRCSMRGRTGGRAATQRELCLQSNTRKSKRRPLTLPAKLRMILENFCVNSRPLWWQHSTETQPFPFSIALLSIRRIPLCLFDLNAYRTTTPGKGWKHPRVHAFVTLSVVQQVTYYRTLRHTNMANTPLSSIP